MKLIFGLGNPEKKYDDTRHNVGFWVLDELARGHAATFKADRKLKAESAEIMVGSEKVLLIKPSTYYNDAGQAARAVMDYYKVSLADFLVIHDELMIEFGTVRTRASGRDAGNNGIKSIIAHLGNEQFARVRIGTGTSLRSVATDYDFVLGRFSAEEQVILQDELLPIILTFTQQFVDNKFVNDSASIKKPSEESEK